jgi:hypothetical protein
MDPLLITNYDVDGLKISTPVKNGKYYISKVKHGKKPIIAQFPRMNIIKNFSSENDSAELEWGSIHEGYTKDVFDWCQKLNNFTIDKISSSSHDWFGKFLPLDVVEDMYKNFIRIPKNSSSGYWMRVCPYLKDDNLETLFYNLKGNEISKNVFKKGNIAIPILKLKYLLFTKDTCQFLWELRAAKVFRFKKPPRGYLFNNDDINDDGEEEDEDLENLDIESIAHTDEFH